MCDYLTEKLITYETTDIWMCNVTLAARSGFFLNVSVWIVKYLLNSRHIQDFLPAWRSAYRSLCRRKMSVCPSDAGIVSKRLNQS